LALCLPVFHRCQRWKHIHFLFHQALYWAITTMTTIGYGDISATTLNERAVACVVMVMGCGFFAWSTGTITSVLTTRPACKERFSDKLEELSEFMAARVLPKELRSTIRSFYMLKFPTMKIFDEGGILSDLPEALANQVRFELFRDVVQKCPLFSKMEPLTQNEICARLTSEYKTEGIQVPPSAFVLCLSVITGFVPVIGMRDRAGQYKSLIRARCADNLPRRGARCAVHCALRHSFDLGKP